MTKNEFISRYGEEAYKKRLERSKEWSRKNGTSTTKAEFIAKYGEEAYENRKKYSREYHHKNDPIRKVIKKEDMIARYGEEWCDNATRIIHNSVWLTAIRAAIEKFNKNTFKVDDEWPVVLNGEF